MNSNMNVLLTGVLLVTVTDQINACTQTKRISSVAFVNVIGLADNPFTMTT